MGVALQDAVGDVYFSAVIYFLLKYILLAFRFPFDFKTPKKYFVLYLCVAISTIPYLSPILAVDALFLGCGLHIAAFFKHLQVQALSLGDDAAENETRTTFSQDQFLRKTRLFVEQHNKIIDLVQGMLEIFGGVFIVQYVGAMFIMCTQAYLSTLVGLIGIIELLK